MHFQYHRRFYLWGLVGALLTFFIFNILAVSHAYEDEPSPDTAAGERAEGNASITIITPDNNLQITPNQSVLIHFQTTDWEINGYPGPHLRVFLDGVDLGGWYTQLPISVSGFTMGYHEIRLSLVDENGFFIGEEDSFQFEVVEEGGTGDEDQEQSHQILIPFVVK